MSDANFKGPKANTEAAARAAINNPEVLAQGVFNDMIKAAKLSHSDSSKPTLDAEHILAGLNGNAEEREAVFTALAADVNNSAMMRKYGLSGNVQKGANGEVESLVFSSVGMKGNSITLA